MSRNIDRLIEIMALLRDPVGGCPWDVEQTFATIAPHTIEEAYEVADAIEKDDMAALEDELGDLLLQVVFHARMAEERGLFGFDVVAGRIVDKLVRRHPHVFGDAVVENSAAQTAAWEALKARERKEKSTHGALEGVAAGLPALTRALKLQKRAARVGFDWNDATGVIAKLREEIAEVEEEIQGGGSPARLDSEVGDLLFSCVNLARKLEVDPEGALRRANLKFETRFGRMESLLAEDGLALESASLDDMDARWERAKTQEKGPE
ncbi:MAG: nucleoside triphosphate pyrophosphohydrolase [Magnetospirillum sp. WYHS-4]